MAAWWVLVAGPTPVRVVLRPERPEAVAAVWPAPLESREAQEPPEAVRGQEALRVQAERRV